MDFDLLSEGGVSLEVWTILYVLIYYYYHEDMISIDMSEQMEQLVEAIVESEIPMEDLIDMIRREVARRKELDSMKKNIAFVLYQNMKNLRDYWELSLTEDDDEIAVMTEGTYEPLPDLEGYPIEDNIYIYNVGNAEAVLNEFLYIDSLMHDSIIYVSIDKICPVV